ncbi:SHOCT domain-containing protein [Cellulosimicrobium funkei]
MDRTTLVEVTVLGPVVLPEPDLAELGVRRSVECTRLEARVRDQAALYGLLQRLAALGLDLVELRTAAPDDRPDVELVVRGPGGALVQQMLDDVGRAHPASSTTYRVQDTDLVGVLGAVTGLPDDDRSGAHVGPHGGAHGGAHDPGHGGTASGGASAMDVRIAQLRDLAALRDRGVLTDAELAEQKARVLEP